MKKHTSFSSSSSLTDAGGDVGCELACEDALDMRNGVVDTDDIDEERRNDGGSA